jgi:hypothetical protein
MSVPQEQVGQAPSVKVPKRFPLAAQPGFRSTTLKLTDPTVLSPVSDSILLNAYAELDPVDKSYWIEKRLGTKTLETGFAGAAGGTCVAYSEGTSYITYITGAFVVAIIGGIPSTINYDGTNGQPFVQGRAANFLSLPINPALGLSQLAWCVNGNMWFNTPGTLTYESVKDASGTVPWTVALCDGCAYLDTVLYVMDQSGNIWGSNGGTSNTWVATTVIEAGGRADIPVALAQQLEYIIAFKSTSFRCFYDAGAAAQTDGVGSNLAWVEGNDGNYGLANAGSLQLIDETLIWVTNNDKATPQIARMDGLQVQIVSTPQVERLLMQLPMSAYSAAPNATTNVMYSSGIKRGGHRFYVITALTVISGNPFTLVYDLDQQMWHVWYSSGLSYWSVTSASAHPGSVNQSVLDTMQGMLAQDVSSGAIYYLDIDQVYPTDSGTLIQVDAYTPNYDAGTRRNKQLNMMYFENDQVSGSKMLVRKSDDDYRSWSPFREVSLSVEQPMLDQCGTFRRRALNLRHASAASFRIKSSDLQMDLGVL